MDNKGSFRGSRDRKVSFSIQNELHAGISKMRSRKILLGDCGRFGSQSMFEHVQMKLCCSRLVTR